LHGSHRSKTRFRYVERLRFQDHDFPLGGFYSYGTGAYSSWRDADVGTPPLASLDILYIDDEIIPELRAKAVLSRHFFIAMIGSHPRRAFKTLKCERAITYLIQ
jgi:hypothetical protein